MSETFDKIVAQMEPLLKTLLSERPLDRAELRNIPKKGIYVLYEGGEPIYVGRSNDIPGASASTGMIVPVSSLQHSPMNFHLTQPGPRWAYTGKTRKTRERDPSLPRNTRNSGRG